MSYAGRTMKVLIVGEEPFFCRGVAGVLAGRGIYDAIVIREAPRARELSQSEKPRFLVLDWDAQSYCGASLLRELRQLNPGGFRVAIGAEETLDSVRWVFGAGANAYVSKRDVEAELLAALEHVEGATTLFLGARIRERVNDGCGWFDAIGFEMSSSRLSRREGEIYRLTRANLGVGDIARRLGVSRKTVETHYHRMKTKLGLRTHADLRRWAMRVTGEACSVSPYAVAPEQMGSR